MATTPVEFLAPAGLTLTCDLFPLGSDTAAATGKSATERTNNKGVYRIDVTEALSGWHRVELLSGTDTIGVFDVYMEDDTADHYAGTRGDLAAINGDTTAADNLELACDNYSATRGLAGTALPAAAADAAGGIPISDAGGLDLDSRLDAAVSSRSSHSAADVATELGNGSAFTEAGGTGDHLTAVPDTSGTSTLLARLTATRAGYLDNLSAGAVATASALSSVASNVSTILAKWTGITSLAEWLGLLAGKQTGDSTARTELRATGAGSGTYDETIDSLEAIRDTEPLGTAMRGTDSAATAATLSTVEGKVDAIDTVVDAILADTGTDGVAISSSVRDAIATSLLDLANGVETGYTVRQGLRLIAAACAGKLSGAATATNTIRSLDDSADRITATVDADGNRSAVTHNA